MSFPGPPGAAGQPRAALTVYRSSQRSLVGRPGVGPVATSLSPEQLAVWDNRLEPLVWAAEPEQGSGSWGVLAPATGPGPVPGTSPGPGPGQAYGSGYGYPPADGSGPPPGPGYGPGRDAGYGPGAGHGGGSLGGQGFRPGRGAGYGSGPVPQGVAADQRTPPGGTSLRSAPPGFVYMTFGAEAAVLRKQPARDDRGRSGSTLTYVLTGPAVDLDLAMALALCRSDWEWLPQEARLAAHGSPAVEEERFARLPTVPLDRLRGHLGRASDDVARDAEEVPAALLAELVAAVFEAPDAPLTVIGAPVSPEAVVHAVVGVAGPLVAGRWTFATHESTDQGTQLPRFVFVRHVDGVLQAGHSRRRITASGAGGWGGTAFAPGTAGAGGAQGPGAGSGSADSASALAAQLVGMRRRRGAAAYQLLCPERPFADGAQVRAWFADRSLAPGVLTDVAGLLEAALCQDLDPAEADYLRGPVSLPPVQAYARALSAGRLTGLIAAWRPGRPDLAAFGQVRDALHEEALRRCLHDADGTADDGVAYEELRSALRAAGPDPAVVRGAVDAAADSALGRGELLEALRVLAAGARVGLPGNAVEQRIDAAVRGVAAGRLLMAAEHLAPLEPQRAAAFVRMAGDRAAGRRARRDCLELLEKRRFLAAAVALMTPDGDPDAAVPLYRALVHCAFGRRLGAGAVRRALGMAGTGVSAALLAALSDTARGRRARAVVTDAVVADYTRINLPKRYRER